MNNIDNNDDRSKRIEELDKNITVVSNNNSAVKRKSNKSLSETRDGNGSRTSFLD
jgi:hypothetical protein